ncbi:MAG TPA: S46 family peptidase [Ignavibacteriales bacterium]|nr:S46 family peptidase [Ignavibacteriales bacterium]
MKKFNLIFAVMVLSFSPMALAQTADTARPFDMGKMWTFENPPLDYFKMEYNFAPDAAWMEKAQKSALKFGWGCSGSFVSEDGLIMSNHHCIRGELPSVEREGEDLLKNGFFAKTLAEERKIDGLSVDQLLVIKDVTKEIQDSMNYGKTDIDKIAIRDIKITQVTAAAQKVNPDLIFRVISLYNGGKYSLYGYKRYEDIRLVFVPDLTTAKIGGDYDNFTYPRHGLDCAFFRAYENGKPVKAEYYFKWDSAGAKVGEPIFVVGNPGSTNRINTMAQIEFYRDVQYPILVGLLEEIYKVQEKKVMEDVSDFEAISKLYGYGNALKVYDGTLKGLHDPHLIARKADFEKKFKKAVQSNSGLNAKYGKIWDEITATRKEAANYAKEMMLFSTSPFFSSKYLVMGRDLVTLANQMQTPEDYRQDKFKGENLKKFIESIYPENFDSEFEKEILKVNINALVKNLGYDNDIVKTLLSGYIGNDAADMLIKKTSLTSRNAVLKLAASKPEDILKSDDPFIKYAVKSSGRYYEIVSKNEKLMAQEKVNEQLLGEALYAVYGASIPPDATGTLRISDGVIKSYEYNGTIAPPFTTFYGILEKHYSYNQKFPFNLPDFWHNLPKEFQLNTPLDFISTNDIIGGNSGSPVINTDGEIIGLAFDGNIESLPNRFLYTTEANRTLNVHSKGMIEAISDLYNAKRLSNELLKGKMEDGQQ